MPLWDGLRASIQFQFLSLQQWLSHMLKSSLDGPETLASTAPVVCVSGACTTKTHCRTVEGCMCPGPLWEASTMQTLHDEAIVGASIEEAQH